MNSHQALSRALITERSSQLRAPRPRVARLRRRAARPPADPPAGRSGDRLTSDRLGHGARRRAARMLCRVPERLTPLDASFLHTETASAHMHVAWKGRFRPDPSRPPITLARVIGAGGVAARRRAALPDAAGVSRRRVRGAGVGRRRGVRPAAPRGGARDDDEVLARGEFDARADAALSSAAGPLAPAVGDPPRAAARGRQRGSGDEDPPRDGRREVRARRRAAAARPRSERARACAASPRRGPEDRAPGPARLAVEALVGSGAEPLRALGRAARAAGSPPRLSGTLRRAALAVGEDVGAVGAVVVPQPADRAAADARRPHRRRRAAARRQARVGRLAQRRRAGGRGRRAATACSAATRGAGTDQGDGSRVAAGRGRDGGHGQPDRVRVHRRCRCTCATRSRGCGRSATRPRRSRRASGRAAARR